MFSRRSGPKTTLNLNFSRRFILRGLPSFTTVMHREAQQAMNFYKYSFIYLSQSLMKLSHLSINQF